MKLGEFTYYHFDDEHHDDLERKGLKIEKIKFDKEVKPYQFDAIEVLKPYLKKHLQEDRFIIGLNTFETDLFDRYKTSQEIYSLIKDEWKYYAKTCFWKFSAVVKIESNIFLIEEKIETHIHYPPKEGKDLFKLLVLPNKVRHFVHLNEFNEEDFSLLPRNEVFRRIENYFYNNFYNCTCFSVDELFKDK